jgi:mRNA interferase RelE/StbE
VSLDVVFEERAIGQAAGFLDDDPAGLRAVLDAIDRLVDDPRPVASFPFGSPDLRRLRVGRYRVLCAIEADRISMGTSRAGRPQAELPPDGGEPGVIGRGSVRRCCDAETAAR